MSQKDVEDMLPIIQKREVEQAKQLPEGLLKKGEKQLILPVPGVSLKFKVLPPDEKGRNLDGAYVVKDDTVYLQLSKFGGEIKECDTFRLLYKVILHESFHFTNKVNLDDDNPTDYAQHLRIEEYSVRRSWEASRDIYKKFGAKCKCSTCRQSK